MCYYNLIRRNYFMKTITYEEFKRELSQYGLLVEKDFHNVTVSAQDLGAPMGGNVVIATVSTSEMYKFAMGNIDDTLLSYDDFAHISKLCTRLAITPLELRGSNHFVWLKIKSLTRLLKKEF